MTNSNNWLDLLGPKNVANWKNYPQFAIAEILEFHAKQYNMSLTEYYSTHIRDFLERQPNYFCRGTTWQPY